MTFDDLKGHTSFIKNVCLHNVDILETFKRDRALSKKLSQKKMILEILR